MAAATLRPQEPKAGRVRQTATPEDLTVEHATTSASQSTGVYPCESHKHRPIPNSDADETHTEVWKKWLLHYNYAGMPTTTRAPLGSGLRSLNEEELTPVSPRTIPTIKPRGHKISLSTYFSIGVLILVLLSGTLIQTCYRSREHSICRIQCKYFPKLNRWTGHYKSVDKSKVQDYRATSATTQLTTSASSRPIASMLSLANRFMTYFHAPARESVLLSKGTQLQRNFTYILANLDACTGHLGLEYRKGSIHSSVSSGFSAVDSSFTLPDYCRDSDYSPYSTLKKERLLEAGRNRKQSKEMLAEVLEDVSCLRTALIPNLKGLQQLKNIWENPSWWILLRKAPLPRSRDMDEHTFRLFVNNGGTQDIQMTNAECIDLVMQDMGQWDTRAKELGYGATRLSEETEGNPPAI